MMRSAVNILGQVSAAVLVDRWTADTRDDCDGVGHGAGGKVGTVDVGRCNPPLVSSGRRDYVLTGVKGIFGPQMSEYVIGYLLAHETSRACADRANLHRKRPPLP